MEVFERALKQVLEIEGDFANHKDDPGGATRWGITEAVARRHGYQGEMRDFPIELAKEIYRTSYWTPLRLDEIVELAPSVAVKLFDQGVNCGIGRAGTWLQVALNSLNNKQQYYANIVEDGKIGPATLAALNSYLKRRRRAGEEVLYKALNGLQCAHYISLGSNDSKFESFVYGWIFNRIG